MSDDLVDYVLTHTVRGECACGQCIDRGDAPDPPGHTVETGFFKVAAVGQPDRETFEALVRGHHGVFQAADPFDGLPHHFIELGAWIGDQGVAMQAMALGALLGCWRLSSRPNAGCVIYVDPRNSKGKDEGDHAD